MGAIVFVNRTVALLDPSSEVGKTLLVLAIAGGGNKEANDLITFVRTVARAEGRMNGSGFPLQAIAEAARKLGALYSEALIECGGIGGQVRKRRGLRCVDVSEGVRQGRGKSGREAVPSNAKER